MSSLSSPVRKVYPSDITREQFEIIRPLLEQARKSTRPRTYDLYGIFCSVLYLLKSGCQWKMLPSDFPKWESVYAYWNIWSVKKKGELLSLLEQILKKISWPGETKQWSKRKDNHAYTRRTECEKYRYCGRKMI